MRVPGRQQYAFALAVAFAPIGSPAHATADGPDRFMVRDVRADDTLALRAQPNGGARKVTTLPPNTRGIENLGCVDGKTGRAPADTGQAAGPLWCKVRIGSFVGWASGRYLREDAEVLKPYSVSGAPTGPGDFAATSTATKKTPAGESRWKVVTQMVVSGSTTADVPNEVKVSSQLIDCRPGRSEVIRLGDDTLGNTVRIEGNQAAGFEPPRSAFDEYNLWAFACRGILRRHR